MRRDEFKHRSVGTERVGWKEDFKFPVLENCQTDSARQKILRETGCFGRMPGGR